MEQHLIKRGFTLVELMVVISIMAILAGGIFVYATQAGKSGRDADRQADLRTLQSAIELYRQQLGRYPSGCNATGTWSGEPGTNYACTSGSSAYIVGLAPTFIPVLPRDPRRGCNDDCGYAYVTNADASVYKLVARKTVESEIVDYTHPMRSCDVKATGAGNRPVWPQVDILQVGLCGRIREPGAVGTFVTRYPWEAQVASISSCNDTDPMFTTSYGVWGGFAPLQATAANPGACNLTPVNPALTDPLGGLGAAQKVCAMLGTTEVICK
jgi:prepilin-type N-terminal cleavage/methylation domain-containing protein